MKSLKNLQILFFVGITVVFFASCATTGRYQDKNQEVFQQLEFSNFQAASLLLDGTSFFQKDRNRLLYLMEKGKLEHMQGNYQRSNVLFEQAYILIDDGIKNSAGQIALSNLSNPMMEKYKGEDFEKVVIHYYKALNFFQLGKADTALVEAKRINIKLNELNDKYPDDKKNKYQYDAFAQVLQGVIYESLNETNDAFIAYRNAEKIYEDNGGIYMGVTLPTQLKKDLLRTSKSLGFAQEHKDYLKKYPDVPVEVLKNSAVVFWENGLGPKKSQMTLSASGAGGMFVGTYSDDNTQIILPIPAGLNIGVSAVAFPEYIQGKAAFQKASLRINGQEQYFEVSQDFNVIAKQCLKDRAFREALKATGRLATKKAAGFGLKKLAGHLGGSLAEDIVGMGTDVAGAAMEKADTRNWQSLPATISYTRVALPEKEEQRVPMTKYGNQTVVDTIVLKPSGRMQIISVFDINNSAMGGSQVIQGSAGNPAQTANAGLGNSVVTNVAGTSNGSSAATNTQLAKGASVVSTTPEERSGYGSFGFGLATGVGTLVDGIGGIADFGTPTLQFDYTAMNNKLASKLAYGYSIGFDYYYTREEDFEEKLAIGDLYVSFNLKKYFRERNGRLTGFNLFASPSIAGNLLNDDENGVNYETIQFKNSLDVNPKFGFGYDFGVGRNRKDRLGVGLVIGLGFLNRNKSANSDDEIFKTGFIGPKISYDFGK